MPKKKKHKPTKSKKLTIKLGTSQMEILKNFCTHHQTTPNKVIKQSLMAYLNNCKPDDLKSIEEVDPRQLDIFSMLDNS